MDARNENNIFTGLSPNNTNKPESMKTATASTSLEIWVTCPHCNTPQGMFSKPTETTVTCTHCKEQFTISVITD